MVEKRINNTNLRLIEGDITVQNTDAIVNAANSALRGGGGVDGAIHRAGGSTILEECKKYKNCSPGETRITSAGNMPSKHVIHTVGPIWAGVNKNEPKILANCYYNSMKSADKLNLSSISFPSISTGVYGYPIAEASKIALSTIIDYIKNTDTKITLVQFVLFGEKNFSAYKKAFDDLV